MNTNVDALFRDVLAPPARAPDTAFARQVDLAVVEHERFARERRKLLTVGLTDLVAAAAVICGLLLLSKTEALAPYADASWLGLSAPLALVLALWAGAQRWRIA